MKILIYGAGSLGSLIGACLSSAHDVTLLCRPRQARAIERTGLHVVGLRDFVAQPRVVTNLSDAGSWNACLVTAKAYDTPQAAAELAPPSGGVVVTLQNGWGNLEALENALGAARAAAALATYGARLVAPGTVEFAGRGRLELGSRSARFPVHAIAEAIRAGGLDVDVTTRIETAVLRKLFINAAINPILAIASKPNGALVEEEALWRRAERVLDEAVALAYAMGYSWDVNELANAVKAVAASTANNRNSMLQDLDQGRRTEIDQINGSLVSLAAGRGIPAPENSALVEQVKRLEPAYESPSPPRTRFSSLA